MAGENIALAGVRAAHDRGQVSGVAALMAPSKDDRLRQLVKNLIEAGMEKAERKVEAARAAERASKAVDMEKQWRGGDDGLLRKAAPRNATAFDLIKREHRRGGVVEATGERVDLRKDADGEQPEPEGALAEVAERLDALKLAKSSGVWVDDARIQEAERLADALGEAVVRAPLSAPESSPPAKWTPCGGDVAAAEGAAALIGGNPDEVAAAIRDGDAHWLERISERAVAEAVRKARLRPVACGRNGPPRF
jgi:hypothetical protein